MKIKIYLLQFAVAGAAFVLGLGVFGVGQYFQSVFQVKEQKTELAAPAEVEIVKIDDLIYPPRNIEQAENSVIEQTVTNTESEETTEYEVDAEGDYYVIGDLPKGFKDFERLSITTKNYEKALEENNWEAFPIPPEGFVFTKKKFKFVRINIADKQIAFETETKKGVSYQFIGKFIHEEEINIGEFTDYAVLEGHLVKMRDGKKIAESKVKFGISHGC